LMIRYEMPRADGYDAFIAGQRCRSCCWDNIFSRQRWCFQDAFSKRRRPLLPYFFSCHFFSIYIFIIYIHTY
jgi:hypothetical protein